MDLLNMVQAALYKMLATIFILAEEICTGFCKKLFCIQNQLFVLLFLLKKNKYSSGTVTGGN
jgi:hypothetical protein